MTYPLDVNQQLLAYLQAWRQLLEPLLSMAPAMPYPPVIPWAVPPMAPYPPAAPPMPPTAAAAPLAPPMPTDYIQQLVGQLQAWRQHLEQMTGARQWPAQASGTQPSPTDPLESGSAQEVQRPSWPYLPIRPDREDVNRAWRSTRPATPSVTPSQAPTPSPPSTSGPRSLYVDRSSQSPWPPTRVAVGPAIPGGSQLPDDLAVAALPSRSPAPSGRDWAGRSSQPAALARGQLIGTPPIVEVPQYGPALYNRNPISAAVPSARSASAAPAAVTTRRVGSSPPTQAARPSLFKGLAERTNSLGGG
jgi:hypothetical protein